MRAATSHNTRNTDARTFEKAGLKLSLQNSSARSIVFAATWCAHSAARNWSFDSGFVRVVLSGKNNGGGSREAPSAGRSRKCKAVREALQRLQKRCRASSWIASSFL